MKQEWKAVGSFGTVGLEIVLSIVFGLLIGRWLDGKLGTAPWMMLVWSGFGVAAAIRSLLRSLRQMKAEAEREEREQGNPEPRFAWPDDEKKGRDRERGRDDGDDGEAR